MVPLLSLSTSSALVLTLKPVVTALYACLRMSVLIDLQADLIVLFVEWHLIIVVYPLFECCVLVCERARCDETGCNAYHQEDDKALSQKSSIRIVEQRGLSSTNAHKQDRKEHAKNACK